MFRFFSILVLLAGLIVAGYGGARMLELYGPGNAMTKSAALESDMAEPAPAEEAFVEGINRYWIMTATKETYQPCQMYLDDPKPGE